MSELVKMIQKTKKIDLNSSKIQLHEKARDWALAKHKLSLISPQENALTAEEKPIIDQAIKENQMIQASKMKLKAIEQNEHLRTITESKAIAHELRNDFKPCNSLEERLIDQMAATHKAGMLMLGGLLSEGDNPDGISMEMTRHMTNCSTKLFSAYRNAMQTLQQGRQSGQQTITVKHQHVEVNGGQAVITDQINTAKGGGDETKS